MSLINISFTFADNTLFLTAAPGTYDPGYIPGGPGYVSGGQYLFAEIFDDLGNEVHRDTFIPPMLGGSFQLSMPVTYPEGTFHPNYYVGGVVSIYRDCMPDCFILHLDAGPYTGSITITQVPWTIGDGGITLALGLLAWAFVQGYHKVIGEHYV